MPYEINTRRKIERTRPTQSPLLLRRIYKRIVTLIDSSRVRCPRGKDYVKERIEEEGILPTDYSSIEKMLIEDMWDTYLDWLKLRTELFAILDAIETEVENLDR